MERSVAVQGGWDEPPKKEQPVTIGMDPGVEVKLAGVGIGATTLTLAEFFRMEVAISSEAALGISKIGLGPFPPSMPVFIAASLVPILMYVPDNAEFFPKGKWATIQYIQDRINSLGESFVKIHNLGGGGSPLVTENAGLTDLCACVVYCARHDVDNPWVYADGFHRLPAPNGPPTMSLEEARKAAQQHAQFDANNQGQSTMGIVIAKLP